MPSSGQFLVLRHEFFGHGRLDAAVVPEDVQGRPLPLGRESHANRAGGGERVVVLDPPADVVRNRADVAGCRFDADRGFQVEELENRPEAVMTHVGDRPAAELIPAAEIGVSVVGVIRAIQRRAEPEGPVETRGDGRRVGRQGRELGPHGPHRPVVDLAKRADGAVLDHVHGLFLTGAFTGRHEVGGDLLRAGRLDDGPGLQQTIRQGFVHDHVHSLLQGRDRDGRVGVIRRHHLDRGHILLLVEQLAEVRVGGTSLVLLLAALLRVVGLHDLLADIAAAGHVVGAFSPGRVADAVAGFRPGSRSCPIPGNGPRPSRRRRRRRSARPGWRGFRRFPGSPESRSRCRPG